VIEEAGQVEVVPCGAERAEDVHDLTQAAFAPYGSLDPPSGALSETLESVRAELAASGGAVATVDARPVGSIRWDLSPDGEFHVGRLAVHPAFQRRGVGRALMKWAEREALRQGRLAVVLGVRISLPGNLAFYRRLGYQVTGEHSHRGYGRSTSLSMRKPVRENG
jgi:ribosomal protein S18 acetylase RimI-like enzyme